MVNPVKALQERWLGPILWVPLGLLLLLLPASAMLIVLRAIYRDDLHRGALPPLQRLWRRLPEVLAGAGLAAVTLAAELILPFALAVLSLRLFTFRISPWLFVPLAVYLQDLAVLLLIGRVELLIAGAADQGRRQGQDLGRVPRQGLQEDRP